MKVTFVYPDIEMHVIDWSGYFYPGIGSLSAVLKQEGHQTSLIHITRPVAREEFIARVKKERPDLLGFSSTSHMFPFVKQYAKWLREEGIRVPVICGGIHPTIAPDDTIQAEGIDMICRGEGEEVLVELCRKMERKEDVTDIRNIWTAKNNSIIKNPLRPLIQDLDSLPHPDRSIFDYPNLFAERDGRGSFMASRGCPYDCTYCCNHLLREIYGADGKSVRFRSVNRFIDEIQQTLTQYPFIKELNFEDDILFLNRKWAIIFSEKYIQHIHLPFSCHARADATNQELVDLLKTTGCFHIKMGIESGNEKIRSGMLNRHMTNSQIKNTYAMCKKAGFLTQSYNIVGLPGDTAATILDDIKLNAEIGVDLLYVTIYQPYHGTRLAEHCREQNLYSPQDLGPNFFSPSILKLKTISKPQVLMFRNYFMLLVRLYQATLKLPAWLSRPAVRIMDVVLSLKAAAGVMNLVYIPLYYVYQQIKLYRHRRISNPLVLSCDLKTE